MAVFENREALQSRMQALIGDRTDDEALNFIQDALETYDSRRDENSITREEHDRLMNEQDSNWRKRYRDTFFSNKPDNSLLNDSSRDDPIKDVAGGEHSNPAQFDDLFE